MIKTLATVALLVTSLAAQIPGGPRPGGPRPGRPGGGTPATSATFTNFGTPCGADLNGTVSATLQIGLDITNAAPNAFGFVAMGQPATTPHPLPVGLCNALLDHRILFGGMFVRTDANGAASIAMRHTPPAGLNISFQAIVITFDATTQTRTMDASNGTTLVTQ